MEHPRSPGTTLARARWDKPENVERRVQRLAAEIGSVAHVLNEDQRDRLRAAIDERAVEAVA